MKLMLRSVICLSLTILLNQSVLSQTVRVPHYVRDTVVGYYELEFITKDSLSDGLVKAVYPDTDSIGLIKKYRNGKLNGLTRTYHPNGVIHTRAFYGQGELNGVWEEYNEEGDLIIKCYYKEGVKHGPWSHVPAQHRGKYKNGEKHGRWKKIEDGQKYIIRFKKGEKRRKRRGYWWR